MSDCKIEIKFDDGMMSSHFEGNTMDLVAGCCSIVGGMKEALSDAHGGELAQLLFQAMVKSGACFEDDRYSKEKFDTKEELDEKIAEVMSGDVQ